MVEGGVGVGKEVVVGRGAMSVVEATDGCVAWGCWPLGAGWKGVGVAVASGGTVTRS